MTSSPPGFQPILVVTGLLYNSILELSPRTLLLILTLAPLTVTVTPVNSELSQATTSAGVFRPAGAFNTLGAPPFTAILNVSPAAKVHPAGVPDAGMLLVADAADAVLPALA